MNLYEIKTRRWLGLGVLVTLLTLAAPLSLACHEHAGGASDASCPVCTSTHAPTLDSQSAGSPEPPQMCGERIATRIARLVAQVVYAADRSRAPPRV